MSNMAKIIMKQVAVILCQQYLKTKRLQKLQTFFLNNRNLAV